MVSWIARRHALLTWRRNLVRWGGRGETFPTYRRRALRQKMHLSHSDMALRCEVRLVRASGHGGASVMLSAIAVQAFSKVQRVSRSVGGMRARGQGNSCGGTI